MWCSGECGAVVNVWNVVNVWCSGECVECGAVVNVWNVVNVVNVVQWFSGFWLHSFGMSYQPFFL